MLPGAADNDREVVHRFSDRHPFLHGDVVVDNHFILGIVAGEEGEQALHFLTFRQSLHELVGDFTQFLVVHRVCLIQNTNRESPGRTEARDCRRLEELELDVGHLTPSVLKFLNDLLRGHLAFSPRLQVDQAGSGIRSTTFCQNFVTGQ